MTRIQISEIPPLISPTTPPPTIPSIINFPSPPFHSRTIVPEMSSLKSTEDQSTKPGVGDRSNGMGYLKTAYFLVATMVGAGFLALPRALADAGMIHNVT